MVVDFEFLVSEVGKYDEKYNKTQLVGVDKSVSSRTFLVISVPGSPDVSLGETVRVSGKLAFREFRGKNGNFAFHELVDGSLLRPKNGSGNVSA